MSHQNNSSTNKAKYQHLNKEERKIIERMLNKSATPSQIAKILMRHRSTIIREIKRGLVPQYVWRKYQYRKSDSSDYEEKLVYRYDKGQEVYENNRLTTGNKFKLFKDNKLISFIEDKILNDKWSPDTVLGHIKTSNLKFSVTISTKTLYNYIDRGLIAVKNLDLLLKLKRKPKKKTHLHKRQLGTSIDERLEEINLREEFGHWEGDGIVGKNQKGQLITLVERKTRKGIIVNVGDRKRDKLVSVLDNLQGLLGEHFSRVFKSITLDNGPEFSDVEGIEKDNRTKAYFCHPYTASERGSNENYNGIIRRFR